MGTEDTPPLLGLTGTEATPSSLGELGASDLLPGIFAISDLDLCFAIDVVLQVTPFYFKMLIAEILAFGTLYPAYSSYKAVKTKNVKEYVKWMMYWIVFALFTTAETITDMVLSWFPFYFELKIAFVIWLLSPYTKGSSVLYRKFVHPTLSNKEKEIDEYIAQAKDRSYETMMRFGKRGLNIAATAAVTAATKGQGVLSEKLRSFSLQDLTLIQNEEELLDDETHTAATLPRAKTRTVRATSIPTDSESQLSSRSDGDQSDSRMEHSDEDAADKVPKRTASMRAAKKPTTAKTETVKTVKKQPKKKSTTTTSNNAETPP
ncbi:receptor expression-enhancing protein 2 isoform X1 [Pangasianodon hypophthalmus]|uniref:receptor expression-enhancing protein 2 isoform X1 n=1 Tax=Pangasianodon hypophthalmus TaxID=310915 RepID=UPI000EFF2241|nr:receptor expression-enhancing protein 2 isoform X1 [Pangasianodon hypophthalmus]